jgi:hypothetical protein
MSMADQNDMHGAEPRIGRRHRRPRIVQNPQARWIFEQDRAIERREFPGGLTERCELHRLRVCGACAAPEAETRHDPLRQTRSHEWLLALMAEALLLCVTNIPATSESIT